jgi:sporulation protein YlmC with PRC-barrel domain
MPNRGVKPEERTMFDKAKRLALAALAAALFASIAACGVATPTVSPAPAETGLPQTGTPIAGDMMPTAVSTSPTGMLPTGSSSPAATRGSASTRTDQPVAARMEGVLKLKLETSDGQPAGIVQDMMVDLQKGGIAYLVIARTSSETSSGYARPGGLTAVPWELVREIRAEDMVVVLTVDSVTLAEAPVLPLDELPDLVIDPNWDSALSNYWSALAATAVK